MFDFPQRTHSNRSRSTSADAADIGSSASVVSTRAPTSPRRVAAARTARRTLVRPEEDGPQISLRHPHGSPPVSASISRIPLETISGKGLIPSCDAGVTPASLGNAASRLKASTGSGSGTKVTARPICSEKTGENIETSDFRERRGSGAPKRMRWSFAFYSLTQFCSIRERLSSANT